MILRQCSAINRLNLPTLRPRGGVRLAEPPVAIVITGANATANVMDMGTCPLTGGGLSSQRSSVRGVERIRIPGRRNQAGETAQSRRPGCTSVAPEARSDISYFDPVLSFASSKGLPARSLDVVGEITAVSGAAG